MRDLRHRGKGRPGARLCDVEDAGGTLPDRVVDLPGFRVAHPGPAESVREPHLDETRTGRTHRVIVEVALAAHHHRFVAHSRGIGEAIHARGIQSREARRGAEQQPGRGARGHHARLGPGRLRDDLARPALKLGHVDAVPGSLVHRGRDLGRHRSAAHAGRRPLRVDDRRHSEPFVDVRHASPRRHADTRTTRGKSIARSAGRAIGRRPAKADRVLRFGPPRDVCVQNTRAHAAGDAELPGGRRNCERKPS